MKETHALRSETQATCGFCASTILSVVLFLSFINTGFAGAPSSPAPNCNDVTVSLNENGDFYLSLEQIVTNCSGTYSIKVVNSYGGTIVSENNVTCSETGPVPGCAYIRNGLKVLVENNNGSCWSQISFHSENPPVIPGFSDTIWCLDPVIDSWELHIDKYYGDGDGDWESDEEKPAFIPCQGEVPAKWVADWITPFDCIDRPAPGDNDLAKIIYREWSTYNKSGKRGVGYDTLYVFRLPYIAESINWTYCPETDTVFCGEADGKIGPYLVVPEDPGDPTNGDNERDENGNLMDLDNSNCDTLCFLDVQDLNEDGKLEFSAWKVDPKCGIQVGVKYWKFDGNCDAAYKVNVQIKQTCPGNFNAPECPSPIGNRFTSAGLNYWECEFWLADIDSTKPIVECKLDKIQPQNIIPQAEQDGEGHCYEEFIYKMPTIEYDDDEALLVCERKELILAPTNSHECAAHVSLPDVCAWDDWSGIKQVKARVLYFQTLHGIHGFPILDKDALESKLTDLTGDKDEDKQIKIDNKRAIASCYYQYRCDVSEYIEEHGNVEGLATMSLSSTNIYCEDIVIWDEEEEDCITVDGDCYLANKTVKLPHSKYPYIIVYEIVDNCHNKYYDLCYVLVKDYTKPVATVDKGVTVSITDKKAWLDVRELDEGSFDNCELNLTLARRVDWYEACVDFEVDTCWIGHHDDVLCQFILDEKKDPFDRTTEVEAHYHKILKWLKEDGVDCGKLLYNAWQYDLLKRATQAKDPLIDDQYFRKIFEIAWKNYGDYKDLKKKEERWDPLKKKFEALPLHPGLGCEEALFLWGDKTCISDKHVCKLTSDEKELIDKFEQIGGGWSDAVPFECADACGPVPVELLVMDYWCNWAKSWTQVWVEDKTPVSIERDVVDGDITCKTYKEARYTYPGQIHPVSLDYIVTQAQAGDDDAFDLLDEIFGTYCKVWRDPYGNYVDDQGDLVDPDIEFVDATCTCTTELERVKIIDEHFGTIWKEVEVSDCYYLDDVQEFKKGIIVVNCGDNVRCEQEIWAEFDHCGQGIIHRNFKIYQNCEENQNQHSGEPIFRTQSIWVGNECPETDKMSQFELMFEWPYDTIIESCGLIYDDAGNVSGPLDPEYLGEPVFTFDDDCRIVGIGYEDAVHRIVGGDEGCFKIVRTWYAQDWCGGKPAEKYWWRNRNAIYTSYEQKILVIDTEAPQCTITGPVENGGDVQAQGCYYNLVAEVDVVDACGLLTYYWELKNVTNTNNIILEASGGDEIQGGMEASFTVDVADLAPGDYKLQARITDDCQNENYCDYTFTVLAGKKPQVVCITSTTAELNPMDRNQDGLVDTAMVTVWASELASSVYPACGESDYNLYVEIIDDGETPTFDGDETDNLVLGCDHIGPVMVAVWAESVPSGTVDYCEVLVIVQDNTEACGETSQSLIISGLITTELGTPVEHVTVSLKYGGGQEKFYETTSDGKYHFVVNDGEMILEPKKDINDINGVSTLDLVKIQKHLLGLSSLESKYQKKAADANGDDKISPVDLIELRKLILGMIDKLSYVDSWRFFENNTGKEVMVMSGESSEEMFWTGVKIGDVNIDNDPSRSGTRANKPLVFTLEDEQLIAGAQYRININTSDFTDIIGYQFTLQSDPDAVKMTGLEFNTQLNITEDNFNLNRISQGIVTASWNDSKGITLPDGENMFTLILEAKKNVSLSDVLSVNSLVTQAEAYNSADQIYNVSLKFDGAASDIEPGFALYQNEPNPFRENTVIGFNLPEAMPANITVYDVTGRVLKSVEGDFARGYNSINLEQKDITSSGVLYYELSAEDFNATRRMIVID